MIQNKITYFIFFLILIGSVLFLFTALNGFYWMDDFWKRYEVVNNGIFAFTKTIYLKWDGRAISPLYTFRNSLLFLFDWDKAFIPIGLAIISQFALGYCFVLILKKSGLGTLNRFSTVFFTLLITLILVLIFRPHLSRSLYWVTGSFYSYANTLLFFSIFFMLKSPNSYWNLVLAFIVVSTGPNSGLFYLTFWFGKQFLVVSAASKKLFFTGLGIGIITLALIVFAPGNFTRSAGRLDFSLINASKGFFEILWEYLVMSKWAFIGSILMAYIIPESLVKNNTKLFLLLFICSLSTILPFVVMPQAASKHTSNFFQTGLFLAFIFLFTKIKTLIHLQKTAIPEQWALLSFALFFIYQISMQLISGDSVKKEIDKRYLFLETKRGTRYTLYLNLIQIPNQNWVSQFWDLEADPDYFNNRYHQKYFGTGDLILIKK